MTEWKFLSSTYVHKNPWYKIREQKVVRPNGKRGLYYMVEAPDGVFVIPQTADQKIVLVQLFRPTTKMYSWEIVAGAIDEGEEVLHAAKRELAEETGYNAATWRQLATFQQLPGKYVGIGTIFLAQRLEPLGRHEQEDEGIVAMKAFTLSQIKTMIKKGEITDGPTLVALLHYFMVTDRIAL